MSTTLAAETNNFLLPNATIFVELALFLIILFVFSRFIVPPLTAAMRRRQEMVQKQAQEREESARRLKEAQERYEGALAEARAEANSIRDEARADAQRIRTEMREETDREVERIRHQGEEQLAAQREQTVRELRTEIGGLSTELASRILARPMGTDGPQRDTIDRFVDDLDQKQAAGGPN